MEDSKQQRSSASLEGTDLEVFHYLSSLAQQRIALQNKCVEMSIQVTSGLAVVVVGAIIASIVNHPGQNEKKAYLDLQANGYSIGIVFFLYGFIQSLLLTNYIYHAVCVHGFYVYNDIIRKARVKALSVVPATDVRSNDGRLFRLGRRLVVWFQPLVVYSSIAFGWLVVSFVLLSTGPADFSFWSAFLVVAFLFLLWGSLLLLFCLHRRADDFAKDLADSDLSRKLPSGDANRDKHEGPAA